MLISSTALAEAADWIKKEIDTPKTAGEFEKFCADLGPFAGPAKMEVRRSITTRTQGMTFESVHLEMNRARTDHKMGPPSCIAQRDIVAVTGPKNQGVLFDSNFYDDPYCEAPVRTVHAPLVFELTGHEPKSAKRRIIVLAYESTTLPCPDITAEDFTGFKFFDADSGNKLLLDIHARRLVPSDSYSTYRLSFEGVTKVVSTTFAQEKGKLPSSLEIVNGSLKLGSSVARKAVTK